MPDPDQDLRDERALRLQLEERLAAEQERTAVWRRRAEERTDRIRLLEERLSRSNRPLSRLLAAMRPGRDPAVSAPDGPDPGPASEPAPARFPVVKVAAAVGADALPIAQQGTVLAVSRAGLASADLVLADRAGWSSLGTDARSAIAEFTRHRIRPPLVFLDDGAPPPDELVGAVVLGMPPTFPVVVGRPDAGLETLVVEGDRVPPSREVILAAARGRPVRLGSAAGSEPVRDSVAARRWAYRYHAPWTRFETLLAAAGVSVPDTRPTVAAVLVSNRQPDVRQALARLAGQTRRPDEIMVGLHGIDPGGIEDHVRALGLSARVEAFSTALTLGEVLNRSVAFTTSTVVAKIDDDDHYGPAYLEDSLTELETSGAAVVGKAAMFLHDAGSDQTFLRRAQQEHVAIPGTMPGGTLVMWRSLWEAVGFPHRPRFVDAFLLDGARRLGRPVRSGHRFEFCLMRHGGGHTFEASADRYLSGAEPVGAGFESARVDVDDLA